MQTYQLQPFELRRYPPSIPLYYIDIVRGLFLANIVVIIYRIDLTFVKQTRRAVTLPSNSNSASLPLPYLPLPQPPVAISNHAPLSLPIPASRFLQPSTLDFLDRQHWTPSSKTIAISVANNTSTRVWTATASVATTGI